MAVDQEREQWTCAEKIVENDQRRGIESVGDYIIAVYYIVLGVIDHSQATQ